MHIKHVTEHPFIQMTSALVLATAAVLAGAGYVSAAEKSDKDCKVIERPAASRDGGSVSSSVTAGNGTVSAQSSGGNSVTVRSGNGTVASAVTTTGSGGSTIVTNSDGSCIIYRDKKE